ncbi:MAG: CpsB/CapC family capsule biosynthesis tyrosine phosphatase [Dehalobacterium sp.]
MIDIHAHILCCGDDGAACVEETIQMAEEFSRTGVSCVVATPHFIHGSLEIEPEKIIGLTEEYNQLLKSKNINLTIVPGMEIEMCHEIPGLLKAGKLLTLNQQGRYMLVELPFHSVPPFTQQVFYELKLLGITPILAHPERNRELCEHPEPIWEMVQRGVLMQINGGSLLGYFGSRVKRRAVSLIESNVVHLIAGDAHQADGERGPCLHLVRPVLKKIVGEEKTQVLLNDNPRRVLEGEKVISFEPKKPKTGFAGFLNRILGK